MGGIDGDEFEYDGKGRQETVEKAWMDCIFGKRGRARRERKFRCPHNRNSEVFMFIIIAVD